MSCEDCKFFFTDRFVDDGFCRRNPPVAAQNGDYSLWPRVRLTWICGEFVHRPWHPSVNEPDRNAPGYGAIVSFMRAAEGKPDNGKSQTQKTRR